MERITLHEEFRLIERNENEVNVAWKGAHLLLFFLAFVFGSFCTFCFHILMYMFEQKCVLFPKIVSHASLRQIVYEFFSINADTNEEAPELPVDFVSTQWVEKSVCYLPTYVPLVSGLFGLVWTTMYLMCSSGGSNLTGLQRQWRAQPPMFVFSVAMGGLCIYSSVITHNGLRDLCQKLAEVTGSSSCTYTVNVATLAYERRIRGVYQATQLTIVTAWLHTACWLLSALLTLVRVILAVDFQLVRVKAELIGDVDRMLEKYERHIRSVSPQAFEEDSSTSDPSDDHDLFVLPTREAGGIVTIDMPSSNLKSDIPANHKKQFLLSDSDTVFISDHPSDTSELALVPEEYNKLARITAIQAVPRKHQFIVKLIYRLLEKLELPETEIDKTPVSRTLSEMTTGSATIIRQLGQQNIIFPRESFNEFLSPEQANELALEIRRNILDHRAGELATSNATDSQSSDESRTKETPTELRLSVEDSSSFNLTPELQAALAAKEPADDVELDPSQPSTSKKPLRSAAIQTEGQNLFERILDSIRAFKFESQKDLREVERTDESNSDDSDDQKDKKKKNRNKNTQTPKEKQD